MLEVYQLKTQLSPYIIYNFFLLLFIIGEGSKRREAQAHVAVCWTAPLSSIGDGTLTLARERVRSKAGLCNPLHQGQIPTRVFGMVTA